MSSVRVKSVIGIGVGAGANILTKLAVSDDDVDGDNDAFDDNYDGSDGEGLHLNSAFLAPLRYAPQRQSSIHAYTNGWTPPIGNSFS